jgi:hypothetical protein
MLLLDGMTFGVTKKYYGSLVLSSRVYSTAGRLKKSSTS